MVGTSMNRHGRRTWLPAGSAPLWCWFCCCFTRSQSPLNGCLRVSTAPSQPQAHGAITARSPPTAVSSGQPTCKCGRCMSSARERLVSVSSGCAITTPSEQSVPPCSHASIISPRDWQPSVAPETANGATVVARRLFESTWEDSSHRNTTIPCPTLVCDRPGVSGSSPHVGSSPHGPCRLQATQERYAWRR